jgi:hypothetical protein
MTYKKLSFIIALFLGLTLVLLHSAGCVKEYSLEGGVGQDSVISQDSANRTAVLIPSCRACSYTADLSISTWSFQNGSSLQCGTITGAVINPERNALTFFGPSSCSEDTGLIITAYFSTQALDEDKRNTPADRVSFEYYDKVTPSDVLKSWLPHKFFLTVESYTHQTGIASGNFNGYAFTEKGDSTLVQSGRFKIRFD